MHQPPSKIVCVGRNYADHAKELGNEISEIPVLFIKPPSALIEADQGISWNKTLGSCHYECELTLRIDKTLKNINDINQAIASIGAVTLGLDLTLRDMQSYLKSKQQPWERAKAFDGSCLLGSWVNVSEIDNWEKIQYTFEVNNVVKQRGDTADLLFSIGELICNISQAFTLQEGDLVMTGTPAGVGALHANDQIKMKLQGKTQEFIWQTFVN